MWIMINRIVPVQEKFRPEFMGIYWGVPWIDAKQIQKTFIQWYIKDLIMDLRDARQELEIKLPVSTFETIHVESTWPEEFKDKFKEFVHSTVLSDHFGLAPNPSMAMRIIVNNEPVKIWAHEYSTVTTDNMKLYLNEGLYELKPSSVSEESTIQFMLDDITKPVYEAALVDGCTDAEAMLMAMGVDVSEKYLIPPIGWYKYIGEPIIEHPERLGAGLSEINHERRKANHLKSLETAKKGE